jgi:pyruvate decarboxylase
MSKIPLAAYILQRLYECGVHHLHGVPGDYSLPFLSHLKHSPVKWIGSCNELNAGYAADGYARMRGMGALCTTYGVGELSAINAFAGSRAEGVSVVHIVGTPSRKARLATESKEGMGKGGLLLHHMLGSDFGVDFYHGLYRKLSSTLSLYHYSGNPTSVIDRALSKTIRSKQPGYITLPSDMADLEVSAEDLKKPLALDHLKVNNREGECEQLISREIWNARRPLIMVDGMSERYGLRKAINDLVRQSGIPTVCLQAGVGVVDSDAPNYYGVYAGSLATPDLHDYVQQSDCVLLICPLLSDTGTAGFTAIPPMENTVLVKGRTIETRDEKYDHVDTTDLISKLANDLADGKEFRTNQNAQSGPSKQYPTNPPQASSPTSRITQDYLWPRLSSYFQSGDTILLANGTPLIASRLLNVPPKVRVIASGLWYSVGQMLPAAQGAALALQNTPRSEEWSGRTILLEGDGSFQATAQELSTIMRYKIDCTIFITNNEGYAYERLIEGLDADFNDVAGWKYALAPAMMGGKSTREYPIRTFEVATVEELEKVLDDDDVKEGRGLILVDVRLGKTDVPAYFRKGLESAGTRLREGVDAKREGADPKWERVIPKSEESDFEKERVDSKTEVLDFKEDGLDFKREVVASKSDRMDSKTEELKQDIPKEGSQVRVRYVVPMPATFKERLKKPK